MIDPVIAKAAEEGAASMLLDVQRECIEWRARALSAEAKLAQAVEDERRVILDALAALERGADPAGLPSLVHICVLRRTFTELWWQSDGRRARSAAAMGEKR